MDFFSFLNEEHNHLLSNITVKQQNHIHNLLQQLLALQEETSPESDAMRKMLLATLLLELKDLCRQQQEQGGENGRVSNHIVEQIQTYIAEHYAEKLTLTGIAENYMFTRLYLSGAQLESLLGGTPEWNTVYGLTGCATEAEYNALRTKLLGCNYVSSVSFTEDTTSMFGSLIGSLNYVVVLVIVCAAALAAVVLYNLISVNLAERKKELATIKVLGFYDKEVYRYIFREIELLSLIGSGVGLLLGVPLHRFIILTVEMDQLMFIRTIAPRSYLLAVALTMLFTVVVCFAMRRHVRHISMVESMKAPE